MNKSLIAIMTCHAFGDRADSQRETWVKDIDLEKFDLRFFVGGQGSESSKSGVVSLTCPDGYREFPLKVQAMRLWALKAGYDNVLKVDDDVYIAVDRLTVPVGKDYVGRLRGPSGMHPAPYCSGFAYWLNRKSMQVMVATEWNKDIAEDRFTANVLYKVGILPTHDTSYQVVWSKRNALSGREQPLIGNRVSISCEYSPSQMHEVHKRYKSGEQSKYVQKSISTGALDSVAVMVKTFLRDGMLMKCLDGLKRNFPDVKIVVVDDGWSSPEKVTRYAEMIAMGHSCVWTPFDSGFGAKSNAAIPHCDREYVLIGSDDFDFSDDRVRPGILKMKAVLDANPSIGIASGRVDARTYESCLAVNGDSVVEEARYHGAGLVGDTKYLMCDLTVNYSLVRRKVLDTVGWDGGEVKIGGGEHGAFFFDVMNAGWGVCVVPEANIYQIKMFPQAVHPSYQTYRNRAKQPGRPCLKKRGINTWTCQDGRVEIA